MLRVVLVLIALAGCAKDTCLRGECPAPCDGVAFQCDPQDGGPLYVGRVADAPGPYTLVRGQGGPDDVMLSNGIVTAVISAIDAPSDLAPTGGNVIDLGPAGGADDLNIIYQLSSILPDDAFAYRTLETTRTADAVRVTLRGTLDGRRDVMIVTVYELRACDRGIRVRSELFNGSAEIQAFTLADAYHWGKRRVAPFSPRAREGYEAPELELLELTALWDPTRYGAGAGLGDDGPGYGVVACDRERLAGVNDLEISALGLPMTFVEPGETLALERMIVSAGSGRGPARAIDAVLAARVQLFDEETQQISGRVTAGGMPFGGDVRRASVIVTVDGVPASAVVPGDDGRFAATVPRGAASLEVWSFGRRVAERPGEDGEIAIALPATLQASVTIDGVPDWATIVLHPADDATRADVTGTFHGRFDPCAPWLGPPHGRSPACNRALVDPQGTDLEVPAGRYQVFATAGAERTLAMQEVTLVAGEIATLSFALETVPIRPPGWLAADLHVHGRRSFDSAIPDDDRVRSFIAAGIDVIAATDHDTIGDYTQTVLDLGFDDRVAVMHGLEATQIIPWLDVPGHSVPRVIGHFNFWPLAPTAAIPHDEGIEPGTLFDRMAPLVGTDGIMMLNHPWEDPQFGRDQGYLRAIDFDPRRPIRAGDAVLRRPAGGHRNIDWNAIEVINGAGPAQFQTARVLYYALLAQGFVVPATGSSDSHSLSDSQLGWARTWIDAGGMTVPAFDARALNRALVAGRAIAGNGIVITLKVGPPLPAQRAFVGSTPYHPAPGDVLQIDVLAAPWVPVEEIRLITSRKRTVVASGPMILRVFDVFGSAGTQRYQTFIPIADLVDRDDFIVVEAGMPLAKAADLDDDGVPDTTDNNLDGVVNEDDVEEGEDVGPLQSPPDPTASSDPRWAITRIIPGAYPQGITNPLLIDLDGDGWEPPGL